MPTKIEWAQETWNPVTGCSPVSEGCEHCYAERMAQRLKGRYGYPADEAFRVTFHPDRLRQPQRWRKPRIVFVCSMGDLFHEDVRAAWIHWVLERIAWGQKDHTFLLLTKRPARMAEALAVWYGGRPDTSGKTRWQMMGENPMPHLGVGVTAENQKRADERIPILLQIPAAMHYVSYEPGLGGVDASDWLGAYWCPDCQCNVRDEGFGSQDCTHCGRRYLTERRGLDWVICGGETGPAARPMQVEWARKLRDQCVAARVPFFFKKWGTGRYRTRWQSGKGSGIDYGRERKAGDLFSGGRDDLRNRTGGRLLDGREWNEWPESFRFKV